MKPIYDFIMAGGGAAGLGLAYTLLSREFKNSSVAIIDREQKKTNDRTWCFWTDQTTPYDSILYRSWDHIRFTSPSFDRVYQLDPFRYQMLRGLDFYRFTRAFLENLPNVIFIYGNIESIQDGENYAEVIVDGQPVQGKWVFDSFYRLGEIVVDPLRYHNVKQHFLGWEIKTDRDVFQPNIPVMFDFRVPQDGAMRFCYILPFSPREALIEYTLFSPNLLTADEYETGLRSYILNTLSIHQFEIVAREAGVIPMTDRPFARRGGQRILFTGTKGGRVKPSTGYAFYRIHQDNQAIHNSLLETGTPFNLPTSPWYSRMQDSVMLQLMVHRGDDMSYYFTELFKNNPIQRLFHFLDESATLSEEIGVMASLPVMPFLSAAVKVNLFGRI